MEDAPQFSPEARRLLDRALGLTGLSYVPLGAGETHLERQRKLREAGLAFTEILDGLVARLEEPLARRVRAAEGRNMDAKLAAIALDRKARPEVYEEITRAYVEAVLPFPRPVATTTPRLSDVHAKEPYRLPWEYFLLKPSSDGTSQVSERALDALEKIRNDASIPTLTHLYQATCREGIHLRQVDTTQTRLLKTLSTLRSERGLRAMLECASMSNRQKAMRGAGESDWDADRFVRQTISGQFGHKTEWGKLVPALPKEGLTVEEKRLLEEALK